MKIFIQFIPVMLFVIAIGCEQDQKPKNDEQAIQNIILQMTESFNKHDAITATQMYTSDADFVTVRGDKYTGAAEIQQKLASIFLTRAKHATLKTLKVTVRFVSPDLAFAHVTNELSGLIDSAGLSLPSHQELSIRVFIKESGIWKVAAFHNSMISPFLQSIRNKIITPGNYLLKTKYGQTNCVNEHDIGWVLRPHGNDRR